MPAKVKNRVGATDAEIAALVRRESGEGKGKKKANAPSKEQREWKIDGVPGMSLAIKPSGVAIYYTRFMAGSGARRKQVRQALGQANGATPIKFADARTAALKIASDGPAAYGDDGDKAPTLQQLFGQFEKSDKKRSARTMSDYRDALQRDVFKPLGHVPVGEITAKDIAKVLTKIESRSPNAAHKCRAALGSLYKWAAKRMLVDDNVMVGMGFTHKNKPRDREVTGDEIGKLWRAIESDAFGATPAMRLILKIAILTGQRNSEVAGARRGELHVDPAIANPHWHIPAQRMKRKDRDQHVFLSEQARKLFAEALALAGNSEFVFPATTYGKHVEGEEREHITQESVSKAWARAAQLAGVKNAHLHDTRKSITSWLGERGERSDVLDRILHHHTGHHTGQRSSVTDTHYNFSVMSGPLGDAWQRWADHVTAAAKDRGSNVRQLKRA